MTTGHNVSLKSGDLVIFRGRQYDSDEWTGVVTDVWIDEDDEQSSIIYFSVGSGMSEVVRWHSYDRISLVSSL